MTPPAPDSKQTSVKAPAESSEFGLKRVLGLREVVAVEIGQTIGAGVFVLTGLAMVSAGGGLPLAYLLAAVPFVFMFMAIAMLGSAVPTTGGTYQYTSRFFSPSWAFTGIWGYIICALLGAFPLYAVSGAKYLQAIWPSLQVVPTALMILTILFAANVLGMVVAAAVQALTVVILLVALGAFIFLGFPHVSLANMTPFLPQGVGGLLLAMGLLTFTHSGSNGIIELGGEIKDARRTIPRSFLISMPIVVVFYVLIAFVATGARPWALSAGQTLTDTAAGFLGGGLFTFFVLGGGVLSIVTTLNSTFMFGTKSLLRMAADGWFPKQLAAVSSSFATPHWILFIVYLVSSAALIVFGEDAISGFAALASIGAILIFIPVMIAALRLKKLAPKEYESAYFKLKGTWYYVAPIVGILLTLLTVVMLVVDLFSRPDGVAFAVIFLGLFALGAIYGAVRGQTLAPKIRAELNTQAGAGGAGSALPARPDD